MHAILNLAQRSTDRTCAVTRLAGWLQGKMAEKGWSRRETVRRTDVAYSALTPILNGETKVPELATLDKLARAFDTPLVRLVELCDYNLGFDIPSDRDRYVSQLIARQPQYRDVIEDLLALEPDDFEAAAKHIEALRLLYDRQSDQDAGKS
jgi:transcriptional regulator with XRE-family HTH domain